MSRRFFQGRSKMSRRAMLGASLGAGAVSLFPWLARNAHAAPAEPKILLFFTPHGTIWDQWRPTGGETNFTLSPILQPLQNHVDRLAIVDGIRLDVGTAYYVPHTYTMPLLWTGSPIDDTSNDFCRMDHGVCFGWNTGVSVDQYIASQLTSAPTPYNTIELGYSCGGLHPATRMIYSAPAMPRSPLDQPGFAFDTLFGGISTDLEQAERDALRRSSVLDNVLDDFAYRRARLSSQDQQRLDAHADSLRELELSLTAVCEAPEQPMDITSQNAIDHQSDLMAAALGCGLTRVGSFQLRIADNDNSLYPWVGLDVGGHHTSSHDSSAGSQATLTAVYTWYAQRFAYLLDRLAATPDVDGRSVLDNTLVIWGSELGVGWTHDIDNVPFVFAGATDLLNGGRYMSGSVIEHGRMLVSACHAMGLTEQMQYGSLDTGSGPIPGLFV